MTTGPVSGVQALRLNAFTDAINKGTAQNPFLAEDWSSVSGKDLLQVYQQIADVAAQRRDSSWQQELTLAFSRQRDFRYGQRSRRWLMARGLRNRYDRACLLWGSFVQMNLAEHPEIAELTRQDLRTLLQRKPTDILPP